MAQSDSSANCIDYTSPNFSWAELQPWNTPSQFVDGEVPYVQAAVIHNIYQDSTYYGVLSLSSDHAPYNIERKYFLAVNELGNPQEYSLLAKRA